jgi:DNA-binding NtrC family response regulator
MRLRGSPPPEVFYAMNVLIVDDQPRIAQVTATAFTLLGCRPFTAPNTAEAERMLGAEKIDALFLDVNLSDECGWDYLSRLVARALPVVVFTALAREEVEEEASRRGALACLLKPFALDDLRQQVARIEQFLHQRKENRETQTM